MSDVPTATKIAALEEQVRQLTAEREEWRKINGNQSILVMLTEAELDRERAALADRNAYAERLLAENVRLTNEAAEVRKELEQYRDSLEVMTTDNNATFEGINAALDAAGITFLDEDTYAACIGRLANERDNARAWIDGQDVRSDLPNATAMRETLDSLRQSIYAACAGTGCLNAHELRQALDTARNELEQYRMRLAGALIASEGGDGHPSDALEYLRTCPTITSVMKLRAALDRERERCGVLEREVKAWRHWNIEDAKVGGDDEVDANANAAWGLLECCQRETDTRHALDAAKFDQHKRGSIIECLDKVRDAGGHAWDNVANPDAVLRGDDDAAKFVGGGQ